MSPESRRPADPVPWDEAGEIVSIILLVSAVLIVLAPVVRYLADGSPYGMSDTLSTLFENVGPVSGSLLVGSAIVVVAVLVEITSVTASQPAGFFIRLSTMSARSLPGTLLAGLATLLARNVVPFPNR